MKATRRNVTRTLLAAIFLLALPSPLATAQEMEVIAGGELEFQSHCAVCHGVDASGNGIMSKYLTLKPANLTQLSKKYGGKFPFWQIYRTIDGREEVRGHGVSQMPVWGQRFRTESGGNDPGAKSQAAGRILSLVFYLQHIQE
jgi:mono/diheme cytochrome c family protein